MKRRSLRLQCRIEAHLITHTSSAEFLAPGMFETLPYLALRIRVLDAHVLAHPRLPIEPVLPVSDAGVGRLALDDVVGGLTENDATVYAAPGLWRPHLRAFAECSGGDGLRSRQ